MLQSVIRTIYPPQCVMCDVRTVDDFALCGACWRDTPFISCGCCDRCGAPLPDLAPSESQDCCDDCMAIARPWSRGRAAMVYSGSARRIVLSMKHGDRIDLARAAGPWMARAGRDLFSENTLVVPVPLHRLRLLRRKFNQAALLAKHVSDCAGVDVLPDGLIRQKRTDPLQGHSLGERFEALNGSIVVNPRYEDTVREKAIVIVDDVMTTGATFAAAAEACIAAGAKDVSVLALARAVKDA